MNGPFTSPVSQFVTPYTGSGQVVLGTLAFRNHSRESCAISAQ
jgi:hypothetical protein